MFCIAAETLDRPNELMELATDLMPVTSIPPLIEPTVLARLLRALATPVTLDASTVATAFMPDAMLLNVVLLTPEALKELAAFARFDIPWASASRFPVFEMFNAPERPDSFFSRLSRACIALAASEVIFIWSSSTVAI